MSSRPDYLVIGHITKDLYNGGYKVGGTATFSALMACKLGHTVGIVTSSGPDVDLACLPSEIAIAMRPAPHTTTFENLYHDGHRRQFLWSQAEVLGADDVPEAWSACSIVHLGPVAQEVDVTLAGRFPGALLGVTPQGWMRCWDERGLVQPQRWHPPAGLLQRADAVVLSLEDLGGDIALAQEYASQTRLLVLTAGWQGATVYCQGRVRSFPAPPVREIDPTGAGDIFATVYFSALHKTRDPWLSAQFANCVASHSVERVGWDSIPTMAEINACRQNLGGAL